ncbi:branched-chain amino acid ABC transporter permease [Bradyrhizobium elkanii]|uniref:branched-chain amino acid ABC transporter permease n=1 Tax=Bradyrhizobium elkanii TaxID=29448 RepID=UPI00084208C7|nr:branched-chain amino acid ABC transporter permease [Bradyrhizobium elkanii]ODM75731.1 ABC transporter permease [Bradyrhizobium elkanii]ODM85962.1 ABC transporter permease [Bradyrhizobium elkanii]
MIAYLVNLATLVCINAILAVTLNFIMGYAGIFSLAHAVFFGIGAYVAAFIALQWTDSLLLQLPVAMLIAGVISAALALPALRVRGDYFVAASLGFQVLAATVFSEWKSVTGGIGGLVGIPPASIAGHAFTDPVQFLGVAGVTLALVVVLTTAIVHSSFGRSLKAIRDSESAALAFGKNVALIKTLSVFYSTAICAVAGVLYADYLSFINVESFTIDASTLFMAMVIVGGIGTVWGPIVGAVLLTLLPAALTYLPFLPRTEIGSVQQMIYGLAMVMLMIFRPDGLMGAKQREA